MLIRHVAVQRFRGIKSLDWHVDGRLVCLPGPGDSTKTTVLDGHVRLDFCWLNGFLETCSSGQWHLFLSCPSVTEALRHAWIAVEK